MTDVERMNDFLVIAPEMIIKNEPLMNYLTAEGFFHCPASVKYHGAYPGGLYEHSKGVYEYLQYYTDCLGLKWIRPESPFIIGMFHDLCKLDQYVEVIDDPGKTMFGQQEPQGQRIHYEYNQHMILRGHGDKSIMILSQFMTLTPEEMMCIRYHMGAYEKEEWSSYDLAIRICPNVLFAHTADMYQSKVMERERVEQT